MTALVKGNSPVPVLQPQTFDQLMRFAEMAAQSAFVPKDYLNKPANVMIAVQMGSEIGLAPMQAIQNIAVINGRPSVWGDALLALVKASPVCDDVIETLEGEGDNQVAVCVAQRKGKAAVERRFSVADAKAASLLNKQGPWTQYRSRMLQMRARGFALRDAFPDVLKGLISAEEAMDSPAVATASTHLEAEPRNTAQATIEHQVPRPVDHVTLMAAKVEQCRKTSDCDHLWRSWESTIEKAEAAGRPIAAETAQRVSDLISDKLGELGKKEFAEMQAQNADTLETLPA